MPSAAYSPTRGSQTQSSAGAARSYYRPQLDGLRFFAFLAVFFQHTFHAGPEYYLSWAVLKPLHLSQAAARLISSLTLTGGMGVDLFFALSAYLITELLVRELQRTGKIHLQYFYIRRILRIWPVYGLVLFLGFALFPLMRLSPPVPSVYIGAYLLLLGNWSCAFVGIPPLTIGLLWSISIEEQFYLFWPFAVRKLGLARIRRFCIGLIAAGVLSRVLFQFAHASGSFMYFNTFNHLDPIAWGALLALSTTRSSTPMTAFRKGLLACACAVGLTAPLLLDYLGAANLNSLLGAPFFGLCCAGAILLALQFDFLGVKPLRYLGKISYGLYAYHGMVLYFCDKAVPHGSRLKLLLIPTKFALTVLLASISYAFLESPILRLKEKFTFIRSRPV